MSKIEELKPCPFCGFDKLRVRNHRYEYPVAGFLIDDCFYVRCRCGIQTKYYKTRTRLVKSWNRRVDVVVQRIQDMV